MSSPMKRCVTKRNNSGYRLLALLLAEARLNPPSRRYRLVELLARMTPQNVQPECGFGPAVGREVIK